MTSSSDVPAPAEQFNFIPDELVLYGVGLIGGWTGEAEHSGFINIASESPFALARGGGAQGALSVRLTLFRGSTPLDKDQAVIAAIYGYAFEGHCYRFDRPRMFLFERPPTAAVDLDASGCGFDGFDPPYTMWRVRSDTLLLELNTGTGTARELILDANLPGKRAPNTYEGHMRLAHRGRIMGGGQNP